VSLVTGWRPAGLTSAEQQLVAAVSGELIAADLAWFSKLGVRLAGASGASASRRS
jgi:hypothetical protein